MLFDLFLCIYWFVLTILSSINTNYTTQLKGGEFPALRYSDEETERLLAEAYAAIPPRAGKRGTLHIKREQHRWRIKREYDQKKKLERIAAHERKMAKRSRIAKEIMKTKEEAPEIVSKEKEYQDLVLMSGRK